MILFFALFFALTKSANIKGELIKGYFQNEDNLKLYLDDLYETRIDTQNHFIFYDVQSGIYMLKISSQNYKFNDYRIVVDESHNVSVYMINPKNNLQQPYTYPLIIQPIGVQEYFEVEKGFDIQSILKSPMGIMFLVFGGLMLCMKNMPKLEELQEAERQQRVNQ